MNKVINVRILFIIACLGSVGNLLPQESISPKQESPIPTDSSGKPQASPIQDQKQENTEPLNLYPNGWQETESLPETDSEKLPKVFLLKENFYLFPPEIPISLDSPDKSKYRFKERIYRYIQLGIETKTNPSSTENSIEVEITSENQTKPQQPPAKLKQKSLLNKPAIKTWYPLPYHPIEGYSGPFLLEERKFYDVLVPELGSQEASSHHLIRERVFGNTPNSLPETSPLVQLPSAPKNLQPVELPKTEEQVLEKPTEASAFVGPKWNFHLAFGIGSSEIYLKRDSLVIPYSLLSTRLEDRDITLLTTFPQLIDALNNRKVDYIFDKGESGSVRGRGEYLTDSGYFGFFAGVSNIVSKFDPESKNFYSRILILNSAQNNPQLPFIPSARGAVTTAVAASLLISQFRTLVVNQTYLDAGLTLHFIPWNNIDPYISVGYGMGILGKSSNSSNRSFFSVGIRYNFEKFYLFLEHEKSQQIIKSDEFQGIVATTDLTYIGAGYHF